MLLFEIRHRRMNYRYRCNTCRLECPLFLLIIWAWIPSRIKRDIDVCLRPWNFRYLRLYLSRTFLNILLGVSGWILPPKFVVKILLEFCHLLPSFNLCCSCSSLYLFRTLSVVAETYNFLSLVGVLVSFSIIPNPLTYWVVLLIITEPEFKSISSHVRAVSSPSSTSAI